MDLLTHNVPSNKFHNLTKREQAAYKSHLYNKYIIIKPAEPANEGSPFVHTMRVHTMAALRTS